MKGAGGDEEAAWDVYADFNNAGPRYSTAFGMGDSGCVDGLRRMWLEGLAYAAEDIVKCRHLHRTVRRLLGKLLLLRCVFGISSSHV